jgi:peptidoglycan/xylan/chitin deacetylase (PgdA/CDA1 family)
MAAMKSAFLKTCSRLGLCRVARGLTAAGVRILAYHGFCDGDEADFQPMLFMRAKTFHARMDRLLRSGHRVIGLDEAVRRLRSRDLESGLAVITIDDGWHGIHEHAWPVLRRLGLPATVYVSSYYAERQEPVANVLLRYLVWKSPQRRVTLMGAGPDLDGPHDLPDRVAREQLAARLACRVERDLSSDARGEYLRRVATALDVDLDAILARRTFHLMSRRELRDLADHGIDLQLHTHRHRFPPDDRAACEREIADNRAFLEPLSSARLEHFCYPSGEYEPDQKNWLRELGIASATTTRHGLAYPDTDPLELPRFLDSEAYGAELFDAALSGLLAILRDPAAALRRSRAA